MTQIDIMGNNFALSAERESVGYFGEKQIDMSAFMVQISNSKSDKYTWQDAFRFIAPFSNDVWFAFFGCMVISAVVVFVLDWSFHVQHRDELEKLIELDSDEKSKNIDVPDQQVDEDEDDNSFVFEIDTNDKNRNSLNHNAYLRTISKEYSSKSPRGPKESKSYVRSRTSFIPNTDLEEETVKADDFVRPHISLFDSFYLAFASFTEAEQFKPQSKSSKIFVASWSMLILIIVATYTANLAAILTKSDVFVEEIQSVNDAVKLGAKTCVSTRNVYYPALPTSYSNTDEISQLYPFVEVNGLWDDLYEYMKNGTCRVALLNREDITAALQNQKYCDLIVVRCY
jgi:hypothetical protein